MAIIEKTTSAPLDRNGTMKIPAMEIPSFRTCLAEQNGVLKNILIKTNGGFGDYACAEPAIRYAFKVFKGCDISIETGVPQFFQHLPFKQIFNPQKKKANEDEYMTFRTLNDAHTLAWEFVSYPIVQRVDYFSLNMFRRQLPIAERCIELHPSVKDMRASEQIDWDKDIVIHPGKTWQSRTVPKSFWDAVINEIVAQGYRPVIIGKDVDNDRSTVDVETKGCLDLRNKLSIMETVGVLKTAKVLFTNDSSPLHMAAAGKAWIGFISTVNDPEYLLHYRNGGELGWRMKNFSRGGVWETFDPSPINTVQVDLDKVDPDLLLSWMPDPIEYAHWGIDKLTT